MAGKFFFEAQAITPTTTAKFSQTASQYAPSGLSPVSRASSLTEAECLNCSGWFPRESSEAEAAGACRAEGSAASDDP
jgi:hypothetical protein